MDVEPGRAPPGIPLTGSALQAVWDSAADALVLSDAHGLVVAANPAYYALYGLTPAQVLGHDFALMFPESLRADARAQYAALFTSPELLPQVESVVRRADGTERIVATRYTFVERRGRRLWMLSIVRDITAQKRAEAERDVLLASASHDLKSPLTTIVGMAQLLQRRLRNPAGAPAGDLPAGLGRIEAAATTMRGLVNEFIDLARLQQGQRLELELQTTDLVALVRQAVQEIQGTTGSPITLSVGGEAETLVAAWDRDRMVRVMLNLLTNAVKYTPAGGEIAVRLARTSPNETPEAEISVADQGIGIPAADLPYVFDPFHRGSNVIGVYPGTGVGLAGAKQIVEQHGGRISVTSIQEQGTTFTVRLPLAGEPVIMVQEDSILPAVVGRPNGSERV